MKWRAWLCLAAGFACAASAWAQGAVNLDTNRTDADKVRPECIANLGNLKIDNYDPNGGLHGGPSRTDDPAVALIRITFSNSVSEPQTSVVFQTGNARFGRYASEVVKVYRLICMKEGDPPISALQKFIYAPYADDPVLRSRLKDELTLGEFVRVIKDWKQQKVRFDTTSMGCPFKLRFTLMRPYENNLVRQLGEPAESRREFVEWLRGVSFDIPPPALRNFIGEDTTVSVPCAILDLT